MPNYYSGADPTTAFSSGLMTGYAFIDNVLARKRQERRDIEQAARADRALDLTESGQRFNQDMAMRQENRSQNEYDVRMQYLPESLQQQVKAGKVALETAELELKNKPEQYAREKAESEARLRASGLQATAAQMQIDDAKNTRTAAGNYYGMLTDLATQPQAAPSPIAPPAQRTLASVAPPAPSPAAAPVPSPVRAPAGGRGRGNAVVFPTKAPSVPAAPAPAPAGGRGRGNTVVFQPKKVVEDAGIKKPTFATDARVATAMQAADASREVAPVINQSELRAITTQLSRMEPTKKLSAKQAETLVNARRYGVIDDATFNNWLTYGGPLAPMQPKVLGQIGENGSLVSYGGQLAVLGGASTKGSTASINAARNAISDAAATVDSMIAAGAIDMPKGSGRKLVSDILTLAGTDPSSAKAAFGRDVLDASGNIDPAFLADPVSLRASIDAVVRAQNGITDPRETALPIEGGPTALQSMPGAQPEVIDLRQFFVN